MTRPQFDITIGKDGSVRIKVSGASGDECIALTDMLRQIVGREDSRELTPEYYGQVRVQTDAKIEGRVRE